VPRNRPAVQAAIDADRHLRQYAIASLAHLLGKLRMAAHSTAPALRWALSAQRCRSNAARIWAERPRRTDRM